MTRLRRIAKLFCLFVLLAQLAPAPIALAVESGLDLETQTSLIEKLELLTKEGTSDIPGSDNVLIRLGDLYVERARMHDVEAGKKNCTTCTDAQKDREAAIRAYFKALPTAEKNEQVHIFFQTAQLNIALDRPIQAISWYQKVIPIGDASQISTARIGIADLYFGKSDFTSASEQYTQALKGARASDKSYIQFRLAWCYFNLGDEAKALHLIIAAIQSADQNKQANLRKDLMRDYATILARKNFQAGDIALFSQTSAPEDRDTNIQYLGTEAERLGNKKGALLIWTQFSSAKSNKTAESSLRIATNAFDLGNLAVTMDQLAHTAQRIAKGQCEDCAAAKATFRTFLISWNKKEKTEPSLDLINAYRLYLATAPDDFEVMIWAAQASEQRGSFTEASTFYSRASDSALQRNETKSADQILLLAIGLAEKSKNHKLREALLRKYAKSLPLGQEIHLVQYQITLLDYKRGEFDRSATDFKRLALDNNWKDKDLRLKAADLSLDSLAELKDESRILSWTLELATAFPSERQRIYNIHRRAAVNYLNGELKAKNPSESELRRRLSLLSNAPLEGSSLSDRKIILKNLIATGEKIKDLGIVKSAAESLMKQRSLSEEERELGLSSLLWVYELQLDFPQAYKTSLAMRFPKLSASERFLKLGFLAELANQNALIHYREFLRISKSLEAGNDVRARIIRSAKNKWLTFDQQFAYLQKTPALATELALELHLQIPSPTRIAKLLSSKKLATTSDGRRLQNMMLSSEASKALKAVSRMKLSTKSDKSTQASIKQRIQGLEDIKQLLARSIKVSHFSLQAQLLHSLSSENNRFSEDIGNLSIPRGLNKSEAQIYRNMLAEQAKGYKAASEEAEDLLKDLMDKNTSAIDELAKAIRNGTTSDRMYAKLEAAQLQPFLSKRQISKIESAIGSIDVSFEDLRKARSKVKSSPMDMSYLKDLKDLESRRGDGPMIAFLDQRLAQIEPGARR